MNTFTCSHCKNSFVGVFDSLPYHNTNGTTEPENGHPCNASFASPPESIEGIKKANDKAQERNKSSKEEYFKWVMSPDGQRGFNNDES